MGISCGHDGRLRVIRTTEQRLNHQENAADYITCQMKLNRNESTVCFVSDHAMKGIDNWASFDESVYQNHRQGQEN